MAERSVLVVGAVGDGVSSEQLVDTLTALVDLAREATRTKQQLFLRGTR